MPANFFLRSGAHRCSKSVRQQLTAQADAEHGDVCPQRLFDERHFLLQMRTPVDVAHAHGAAHYDEPIGVERLRHRIIAKDAYGVMRTAVRIKRVSDAAWRFRGYVLQDEYVSSVRHHGVIHWGM